MKICIIGNSQAAALKQALAGQEALQGHQFSTYAVAGGLGPHLGVENGRIVPVKNAKRLLTDIEGAQEQGLDLGGFEGVLYSAAGLPAHRTQFDFHILNKVADAKFCSDPGATRRLLSHAAFVECVRHSLRETDNWKNIDLLRQHYSGPIVVQSWPLPTTGLLEREDSDLKQIYGDRLAAFLRGYYTIQIDMIRAECERVGAIYLPLPIKEALAEGFTPDEYGSPEPWHMNATYGEKVLVSATGLFSEALV